jgi:WD40 repeat protein/serine/threonine protein kinase
MGEPERQIMSLLGEALEHSSPEERAAFLDKTCAGDAGRRARVEELLRAHQAAGNFLQGNRSPAAPVATVDERPLPEGPGTVIGPYKLLEPIGEGGMGTVWMAQQTEPVKRLVALKLIKAGMDSRQVIARFEAERQALALMDHTNIARVLDAGTTSAGRPYFVMDLVKGAPITRHCDEHRLTPRQRLEIFIPVCQAVQHAHQKGIIHRDLKPSNVLIALYDGKPVPKVIDFGVAKAAGPALTDKTLVTGFGHIIGTLEYMSPEQAEINQLDIDTRSDIYSLGVLLYELLTGTTPLERKRVKESGMLEALRIIREEDAPTLSDRLVRTEELPAIAANRGLEPAKLTRLVRGELDWIVMKALEKDRGRRYESASAFAADVQRYLNDEPVQACPPSAGYRLRKWARRNKGAFLTSASVVVALLLGVGSLLSAVLVLAASNAQVKVEKRQADEALKGERQAREDLERTAYVQSIALAGRELAAGNVGRAEELLSACPEHLRGWEWRFLKRQRYGNPPPVRHNATVVRVVFSPDGGQIATVCMDGTLAIRDARAGEVLHPLEQQTVLLGGALVRGMAYSPDGRYLAAARNDGEVRVWDASSGQRLHTLKAHQGPAWQVAFSPDGRTLASGGSDRKVRLWDLTSGRLVQEFSGHPAEVKGVAFRPDGRSVVAACDDGTVKVWDGDTGQTTFSFHDELLAYPWSPWFSPDARRLAWACLDGVVKVWDTTTGRLEIDQQSNLHQCRAVAFSPDGQRIALAGFDGTVRLLDAVTGKEMLTIFAHPSLVAAVAFSPDGHQLASASYDDTVRLWDARPLTSDPLAPHCVTLTGHKEKVSGVAFSSDGRWLASASWDHTVKVWETGGTDCQSVRDGLRCRPTTMTLRYTLRGHRGVVVSLALSPDNRTLATASWDNTVKLWDLQTPGGDSLTEIRSIPFTHRVSSVAFSPDGQLVAVGQDTGIALLDPASGQPVHPFKRTPAAVPSMAFHPDRPLLITTGASDPAVKVWAVDAKDFSFEIRHNSNPNPCIAVSPDGRRVAAALRDAATGDHIVRVWDMDWEAKARSEFRTLRGHRGYVWRVAFSPDGRYLASGSWDSKVRVWDLEAPESSEPVTLHGSAGFIQSLAFSPDGRRLATGSGYAGQGEVKVWDATLWQARTSVGP